MADRTKLWIADKMKEMMEKKPIEKIRVSDLCRQAEISKPTFYYHFRDKYDLVAWIFFRDAGATDIIDVESSSTSMANMKKEIAYYRRAYEDDSQNAVWRYMPDYFTAEYIRIAKEKLGGELDPQLEFSIRLYCHGSVAMTKEWALGNSKTSAKDLAKMMFASMPDRLRKIYFPRDTLK